MCEDGPDVTALAYLQTDVASVVDHANAEEAATFRSLLIHLLARPSRPISKTPRPVPSEIAPSAGPSSSPQGEQLPRNLKRTRSESESEHSRTEREGDHTVIAAQDVSMAEVCDFEDGTRSVVRMDEDLEESSRSGASVPPSGERYKQRTQVFERLLLFVNDDEKQPQKDLLDLVDMNDDI